MDGLKLACDEVHVADIRTCVLHPASETHRQLTDEQLTAAGINPGELRQLPMALPGEDVLPIGEAEPPAQELIPGTEQVARMADPDTGEIIDHYESERQRLGLPKGAEIPNPFREMTPEQIEQIRAKAFQAGLEARGQGRLEI